MAAGSSPGDAVGVGDEVAVWQFPGTDVGVCGAAVG